MLIHSNIRTHTNAWTFKSVSHVFLLIFACVFFRLLLPVYLCEHLALALSHLGSLRHAGETNTNATPGSRQRLSGLSLGLTYPHSLLLRRPHNANSPGPPISSVLSLIHINVSGGGSNAFLPAFKCTFRCCWLLLPLILAVFFFFIVFEAAATLYLYSWRLPQCRQWKQETVALFTSVTRIFLQIQLSFSFCSIALL